MQIRGLLSAAVLALMAGVIAVLGVRPAAHNRQSQVTWTIDIEPIMTRRCIGCHAPNGFAPMSLATYQDARAWAPTIRREVLERRMPPWPAAPGFGEFANDRSLTPLEVELLAAWAEGATPIGPDVPDPEQIEAARSARETPPDLVLTVPTPHPVTRSIERIELPTAPGGDRWITQWELRPGNRSIVEQAVLWILPDTLVGAWTPPEAAIVYPPGVAQRLPAGARLSLELHYRKSATPQLDRSAVALRFGRQPRYELRHRTFSCDVTAIDRSIEVLAVMPHASAAGASVEVVARQNDGGIVPMSVVPRYEPAYPITYRLRTGIRLARGTAIDVRSSSPDCGAVLEYVVRQNR